MRVSKEGEDKEADVSFLSSSFPKSKLNLAQFLALRLLNKRARVRLSPEAISLDSLPGKGALFAVANHAGLFAAAVRSSDGTHCMYSI